MPGCLTLRTGSFFMLVFKTSCYKEHTINHFKGFGLDHQQASLQGEYFAFLSSSHPPDVLLHAPFLLQLGCPPRQVQQCDPLPFKTA
eukprot:1150357-Pelagomonas_calceolata.AAC.2